jgi:hypothetical protein
MGLIGGNQKNLSTPIRKLRPCIPRKLSAISNYPSAEARSKRVLAFDNSFFGQRAASSACADG